MTSTFEIQNFKKIDRRKQKLLNCKPWRGQMKFLNNAGYQSTVGSLLNIRFGTWNFDISKHALCLRTLESIDFKRVCRFFDTP